MVGDTREACDAYFLLSGPGTWLVFVGIVFILGDSAVFRPDGDGGS
jgi:hypothetical protein